jgi:DNA-binding LytR/AlgR family response regulator
MNFHINKSINNRLKDDEININIELSNNNNEMENIIEYIKNFDNRKMVVYDGYNMIQINIEDILFFYSDGNYNFCKTIDKSYRVKSKLYEIDKKSNDFLRISKSCIVNINQVKSFDIGENRNIIVKLNDESEQYVSRRKIKEVINYLDERMI